METTYHLAVPDSAEATLTITMTLSQWRRIGEACESSGASQVIGPIAHLLHSIREVITKATRAWETSGQVVG